MAGRSLLGGRVAGREGLRQGAVSILTHLEARERGEEGLAHAAQRHAVLRAARPRKRGLDPVEVELDALGVGRSGARIVPEEVLLAVGLDQLDLGLGTAG